MLVALPPLQLVVLALLLLRLSLLIETLLLLTLASSLALLLVSLSPLLVLRLRKRVGEHGEQDDQQRGCSSEYRPQPPGGVTLLGLHGPSLDARRVDWSAGPRMSSSVLGVATIRQRAAVPARSVPSS